MKSRNSEELLFITPAGHLKHVAVLSCAFFAFLPRCPHFCEHCFGEHQAGAFAKNFPSCQNHGGVLWKWTLFYCATQHVGLHLFFFFLSLSLHSPPACTLPAKTTWGGNSMQGYTQLRTDNFDWTLRRGSTPSSSTGPTQDHTTGTSSGMSFLEIKDEKLQQSDLTNSWPHDSGCWLRMYTASKKPKCVAPNVLEY